jgi:hypothetical protein
MEFARFLGLPVINPRRNTIDVTSAVCQVLVEARTDLVLVDEIHLLNHATTAGEDVSDHLKYFTEHLPATFIYAGINVEQSGLFTGVRGRQLAGRCLLVRTGPPPPNAEWRTLIASIDVCTGITAATTEPGNRQPPLTRIAAKSHRPAATAKEFLTVAF